MIGNGVCHYAFILVIWCVFGIHTNVVGMIVLIETNRLSICGCLVSAFEESLSSSSLSAENHLSDFLASGAFSFSFWIWAVEKSLRGCFAIPLQGNLHGSNLLGTNI